MSIFLPTGKEIKEYEFAVGLFIPKDYADVMTREEWLECVENGDFIPYDGTLGEIVIDGYLTVYELEGWGHQAWLTDDDGEPVYFGLTSEKEAYRIKQISMKEFKALEGNVQVCWYNR